MKIACPACAKPLAVADQAVGRSVRCPACKLVFEVPRTADATDAQPAELVTAEVPRRPRREQGLTAPPRVSGPPPLPSSRPSAEEGKGGCCYIDVLDDEVKLITAVQKRFQKLIVSEELDLRIMNENLMPPVRLAPDDVVISAEVTRCDHGNQFIRYFLSFVAMFGPGSSILEAETEVELATGEKHQFTSRSRRWAGFFGGANSELMKENVRTVASKIAYGAARFVTGRHFLNAQVYECASWSLGLSFLSLLPWVGVPFALISLTTGVVALVNVNRRELPRGRGRAVGGLVLSVLGLIVTVVVSILLMMRR